MGRPLVVCDVALFYAERSGGIRTYLDEKARYAARTGAFEHHVAVPGRRERHEGGRHELPSAPLAASNGYRVPYGSRSLRGLLRALRPDVVVLHDPFWRPARVTREAHALGARVIAVHHASAALNAAGLPGPDAAYLPLMRRRYRAAYAEVDAVMAAVDPMPDAGRGAAIPLRLGLHPAFRPGPAVRGEHLLYVGRLALEKRVCDLLDAVAAAPWERPVWLLGEGPHRPALELRAARLGLAERVRFLPFEPDRGRLAAHYRAAACVVAPGPHETFGLSVLEAAACGARVVACSSTPAAGVAGPLVRTFAAKDPADLLRALDRALATAPDPVAAAALADRSSWDAVFAAELEDVLKLAAPRAGAPAPRRAARAAPPRARPRSTA